MRFRTLPQRLKLLLVLQAAAAALLLISLASRPLPARWDLVIFLAVCGAVGGAFKIDLGTRLGHMTLGFTITAFSMLLLGTPAAVAVGLAATLAGTVIDSTGTRPKLTLGALPRCQALFNITNSIVATWALGTSYQLLGGHPGRTPLENAGLPIVVGTLAYFFVNVGAVSIAIAWSRRLRALQVYKEQFAWSWPGFLGGAGVSAALLWLHQNLGLASPAWLILPPGYIVWSLYRMRHERARSESEHIRELNRLNEAVISSLAMAIEAKDPNTRKHVNRVREYAIRLAEALKVERDDMEAIRIASLLHDIGKVGIPESILCKQGKLTADEFEIIKSHVELGAALLEQVQFPWPVVPIVRTHHERWDGLGYPQGLKGEAIPIGGRIISLVDVFDALTSERPYRRAITREQAIRMIRAASGTQFDPRVVDTFIDLLPEMEAAVAAMDPASEPGWASLMESVSGRSAPVLGDWQCDEEEDALVLGSLSHLDRHGNDLPELVPTLAEALRELTPFTTLAVFVPDADRKSLQPIYAEGLWTELIHGMDIRLGEGVSGLVAVTGEPCLNANATIDLARRVRPGDNLELNSTLCVPVRLAGEVIAVVTLYHTNYSFYQPYHLRRLARAADCLAEATLRRSDVEDTPLLRADPVTGLPSPAALVQFIQGQITVAGLRDEEFAVVRFRLGADRAANQQVQATLMELLAATLRDLVRDGDFLSRDAAPAGLRGLALVLPRCGERQAVTILGRVCERVHAEGCHLFSHDVHLDAEIRLYPRDGQTAQELLLGAAAAGVPARAAAYSHSD